MPKLIPIFLALVGLVLSVVAVYAYFTSLEQSNPILFGTGSLAIELTDPNQLQFANLAPGDERQVEWQVKNTGSLNIQLKGRVDGRWESQLAELSSDSVKVTKVEYLDGENWIELVSGDQLLGSEWFYASDGGEGGVITLQPEQVVQYRLTALFDPTASDQYQEQTFQLEIHQAAKQTSDQANWPSEY